MPNLKTYFFDASKDIENHRNTLSKSTISEQREIAQAILDWHQNENFEFQTSGSTGTPKSISFSKAQVEASITQSQKAFGLSSEDVALISLPMKYVAGKMMLFRSLKIGMDVYCIEPKVDIGNVIGRNISFAACIPQQIESLLNIQGGKKWLESIRIILIGGGPISAKLENSLKDFSNDIYHTYGMTETLTHVAIKQLSKGGFEFFTPLPNVSISQSENDTIKISANHLGITLESNDVVEINPDSSFKILGRIDNVINSGGVKIHPEEIEKVFKKYLHCDLVVLGMPDETWGESVVLVVESQNPIDPEWINMAKSELPKIKWPKVITYIDRFPRTKSGKVQRKLIELN